MASAIRSTRISSTRSAQMPQASGVALGFDRLVMLASGAAQDRSGGMDAAFGRSMNKPFNLTPSTTLRHRKRPSNAGTGPCPWQNGVRRQLRTMPWQRRGGAKEVSTNLNDDDWRWGGTVDRSARRSSSVRGRDMRMPHEGPCWHSARTAS